MRKQKVNNDASARIEKKVQMKSISRDKRNVNELIKKEAQKNAFALIEISPQPSSGCRLKQKRDSDKYKICSSLSRYVFFTKPSVNKVQQ